MSQNYAGNYNYNYNYAANYNYASGGGAMSNTPVELNFKPWCLDYTPDTSGKPDLPSAIRTPLITTAEFGDPDWDKSLFAILALRELGVESAKWTAYKAKLDAEVLPSGKLVTGWKNGTNANREAFVTDEINYLLALMQDDRDRFMPEIVAQADGAPFYFTSLLNLDPGQKPWTSALTHIAARFGEMLAMYFKYAYKRARPSIICPGLLPTFGPPRHPAFPSGHATQVHMMTQMLLQIDGIKDRYGSGAGGPSELQWLAARIAKNRERVGVHYPSDSYAGMKLAEWLVADLVAGTIVSDMFKKVLDAAKKEW